MATKAPTPIASEAGSNAVAAQLQGLPFVRLPKPPGSIAWLIDHFADRAIDTTPVYNIYNIHSDSNTWHLAAPYLNALFPLIILPYL